MKYLIDLYGTCLLKNRNFETIHNINKRMLNYAFKSYETWSKIQKKNTPVFEILSYTSNQKSFIHFFVNF